MKTNDQTITTDVENLNEILRLQKMLAKEHRNPVISFLNPKTFSIKLDSDLFFTMKMSEDKQYQIDAIYKGEDRKEPNNDEWMGMMEFLTEVEKVSS